MTRLFTLLFTLLFTCLMLIGCKVATVGTELKCVDGVLYMHDDGAWVQALLYRDNKCLPDETK